MVQLRIEELMRLKSIKTQKELAEKSGINETVLSRIVNGTSTPNLDSLDKIAIGLGVEISELFLPRADKPTLGNQHKVLCPYCFKPITLAVIE